MRLSDAEATVKNAWGLQERLSCAFSKTAIDASEADAMESGQDKRRLTAHANECGRSRGEGAAPPPSVMKPKAIVQAAA